MLHRFLAVAACLGLVSQVGVAHATQARIDSMGGGQKEITVEDEINTFFFPSLLVRHGNMTYIDNLNEGFGGTRFGFHYSLTEDMVLGVYGGRINATTRPSGDGYNPAGNTLNGDSALAPGGQASQAQNAQGGPSGASLHTGEALNNVDYKIGFLYALRLGATARLGFMLNILGDDADVEQPDGAKLDQGAFLIDFGTSIGFDLAASELEIGLGLEIGGLDDQRDVADNPKTPQTVDQTELLEHWSVDSHIGFRLNSRWIFDFFDQSRLATYARLEYATQEVTYNALQPGGVQSGDWNAFDFKLGADLIFEPFQDVFVVPGLGLRYAQQSLEGSMNVGQGVGTHVDRDADRLVSFPFYGVGVDAKVLDWLDFRFGASQSVDFERNSTTTTQGVTTEARHSDVRTEFTTGLGFNIPVAESTLTLDLNVNPMFWVNGPDFVTGGANNTDDFGINGAIKYDW
ncbi:MAG: hypothetical protein ACQEXJ_16010 [Myxococcota bacterium]